LLLRAVVKRQTAGDFVMPKPAKKASGYPRGIRRKARRGRLRLGAALKRGWVALKKRLSLKSAALATFAAVVVSVIQIFISVHGKLVILPFQVRSGQNLSSDFGETFAASLSAALNDYRSLFPSAARDRPTLSSANFSDLIEAFMLLDLPFVELPKTSPLNKGATVLEAVKIGLISIPVSQVVFENLGFFHDDTVRGSLDLWENEYVARISFGSDEMPIVVSVPKGEGYQGLINRVTAELLQRRNWIAPLSMKLSALTLFSEGLRNYLDFDRYAEDRYLVSAAQKYKEALQADQNADLIRLHLAAAQYMMPADISSLERSIENFFLLLASDRFKRAAQIGYVAASIRYLERSGCGPISRLLLPVREQVVSWSQPDTPPSKIEELLLWSSFFQLEADLMLPNGSCQKWVRSALPQETLDRVFSRSRTGFDQALALIETNGLYAQSDAVRYKFFVQRSLKYLLDDMVDFSILTNHPNIGLANEALELGKKIQKNREALPEERRRLFVTSIAGSIASSYLRVAKIKAEDESTRRSLVSLAADQFRIATSSTERATARWALFRLADLELGRSNLGSTWLIKALGNGPALAQIFDEAYLDFGVFFEKATRRCEAIRFLGAASEEGSIFSGLLLVDALRRQGNLEPASTELSRIKESSYLATQWIGDAIEQKLVLVGVKLQLAARRKEFDPSEFDQFFRAAKTPTSEVIKFDLYELADLTKNEAMLTQLKSEVLFPRPIQSEIVDRSCSR
jgi:hypothetical protein